MRSPLEAVLLAALIGCAAAVPGPAGSTPAGPPVTAAGPPVTGDEIRAAVEKLRKDPHLGREQTIRKLHWNVAGSPRPPQPAAAWIVSLFEYLGRTAKLLLWVAGTIAAGLAVIWILRTLGRRQAPFPVPKGPAVPDRIGDQDIRAESLPGDIGAAALALAEAGRTRAALALLYRGALSRAVHRFAVPIGESFTEGEALRAVALRLEAPRADYFRDLVDLWRRVVYAGDLAAREPLDRLCRRFASALDAPP